MSFLIIIPGFGGAQIEKKKDIFSNNISILSKNLNSYQITIQVFNFDCCSYKLDEYARNFSNIISVQERLLRGVVGQFIFNYIKPDYVETFDNVIILLDDIELDPKIDFNRIKENYTFYKYDILSPSLSKDSKWSHQVMLKRPEFVSQIRQTNLVELFCYFMSREAYRKYYGLLNQDSAWLWGIDFSLYHHGFKCGVLDLFEMKHHFKGDSYSSNLPCPVKEMDKNRMRFEFIDFPQSIAFDVLI